MQKNSFAINPINRHEKRRNILTVQTDASDRRKFNSPHPQESKKRSEADPKKYQNNTQNIKSLSKRIKQDLQSQSIENLAKIQGKDYVSYNDNKQILKVQKHVKQVSEPLLKMTKPHHLPLSHQEDHQNCSLKNDEKLQVKQPILKSSRHNSYLPKSDIKKQVSPKTLIENKYKSFERIKESIILEASQIQSRKDNQKNTSIVIQARDIVSSDVADSKKEGKLRKCLSLQLKGKEQNKMKLRDYLYLNSISGIRKKVLNTSEDPIANRHPSRPYIRVRQFSSDQILSNKIKSEIQKNIGYVIPKLQAFGNMGNFQGNKLMLSCVNNIIKEKIVKGLEQIEKLIRLDKQRLV